MRSTRRLFLSLLVVVAVVGGIWSYVGVAGLRPRLGLDLKGGTSVTFQPRTPSGGTPSAQQLSTTVNIIRNRVNAVGVAQAQVATQGPDIVVSIPDVRHPDQVIAAVGTTAQLQFRPVLNAAVAHTPQYTQAPFNTTSCAHPPTFTNPHSNVVLCTSNSITAPPSPTAPKLLLGPVAVAGTQVSGASAVLASAGQVSTNQWQTNLQLNSSGAAAFQRVTAALACNSGLTRELGITLDGQVINSPQMGTSVACHQGISGGSAQITGLSQGQSQTLATLISTGALPLTLTPLTRQTVSATLGAASLRDGLIAGAIGIALVYVYVLAFYRGLGLVAWVGLFISALVNLGLVIVFGELIGFTLTLPGIAGLIAAVGISSDSYIVFFERLKDEVRDGRTLRSAVDRGWRRAFRTLMTANTVSLAAAVILYIFAIGSVRGFAFTLGMATIINVFTAWFFTRAAVTLLLRTRLFQEGRLVGVRAAI